KPDISPDDTKECCAPSHSGVNQTGVPSMPLLYPESETIQICQAGALDKCALLHDNFLVRFEAWRVVLLGALYWCLNGCAPSTTLAQPTAVPSNITSQATTSTPTGMIVPPVPPTMAPVPTSPPTSSATPVFGVTEQPSPPAPVEHTTPEQTAVPAAGMLQVYEDRITLNVYPYTHY